MSTSPLVEAAWLLENQHSVTILDVSVARLPGADGITRFAPGQDLFAQGHIPGTQFADIMGAFSDPTAPHPFTCPRPDQLQDAARALGLGINTPVIAYDSLGGAYAARLWCVLRGFGARNVRVLNGGLAAWQAAGGALETGPAGPVPPGDFTATATPNLFVDTEAVARRMRGGADAQHPLLCALRPEQFAGTDSTHPRRGHIPTSLNLPYPSLLGADGRLTPARVHAALDRLGLGDEIEPILYCGGGINAAGLALGLALIGITRVKIYDDSMSGWRADPSLPVEHE